MAGVMYLSVIEYPFMLSVVAPKTHPGNTKGGSIIVLLTSCLTGLELAV